MSVTINRWNSAVSANVIVGQLTLTASVRVFFGVCESDLLWPIFFFSGTYSNLYNHPKTIDEPRKVSVSFCRHCWWCHYVKGESKYSITTCTDQVIAWCSLTINRFGWPKCFPFICVTRQHFSCIFSWIVESLHLQRRASIRPMTNIILRKQWSCSTVVLEYENYGIGSCFYHLKLV